MQGHSGYYYLDIGMIVIGAFLALTGELLVGGVLFLAGAVVHFDWISLR